MPVRRHVQCLSVVKHTISPCFLKHPFILFLKMQHMLVKVKRFVIDQPFSFISFFFHSSLKKYSLVIFIFCISVSVFILFIFNFCSWPFYKSFSCFLFSPSILICHVLLFQFSSYSFDFYLGSFDKVLLIFNFILQTKFMVYCFFLKFDRHSFDYFFYWFNFSFQFNPLIKLFWLPSNLFFILIFTLIHLIAIFFIFDP